MKRAVIHVYITPVVFGVVGWAPGLVYVGSKVGTVQGLQREHSYTSHSFSNDTFSYFSYSSVFFFPVCHTLSYEVCTSLRWTAVILEEFCLQRQWRHCLYFLRLKTKQTDNKTMLTCRKHAWKESATEDKKGVHLDGGWTTGSLWGADCLRGDGRQEFTSTKCRLCAGRLQNSLSINL